ncbi:MarR family winged helix-turn-helix transcriptional regulator [Sphingobium sp. Cam5-1]|uniref:MarR family winged helix-turn-helix transcriptional regulator n=1 Tax=Sphingobium sp. Cam5-1 TaxID=2789327 RepID=UPI0018AD1686|nr:MarR family winged helix-turn-helix transcriptional regulator [Sphingobium sp. Cam5-1]QPI74597.1 winged helix-turn-helix transcriptional regulator [Sphingobium sp. Cam5-1]
MSTSPSDKRLINPVASRLGYRLRRTSSGMMATLGAALELVGLRPVEATILMTIGANPGCIQSDIGRMLGIKRANMVPLITGLIQKDLVQKSPVDGRSFALCLTTQGKDARREADAIMSAHERRYTRLLTPEYQDALRVVLDVLEQEENATDEEREAAVM